MADGTIIIDTKIDSSGAEKGISSLSTKLGSIAKGGLGLLTKGIVAAGTALSTAGVSSIKLASDLTEVQNVVDTTFGNNAGEINKWAKQAATSFGMSELQAKQFNGAIGAMFKSMGLGSQDVLSMSQGITGLAGDFASFYNLKPEEAFEKLRSGISGETEPLKQLGINMSVANLEAFAMSQGITKSYQSMSQAEQATLRYNYLLSVSKDAQGDFARTSDSLANQLRIAKLNITDLGSSIGQTLIPVAQDAVSSLNGMIGELKNAFTEGGFAGLAGALGNVLSEIITQIASQLPKIVDIGVQVIQSLITGIQNNLPQIATSVVQIANSLVTGILTMLPQLLSIGMQCIAELANGIAQQLPNLIPLAVKCVLQLVQAFYDNMPSIIQAGMQLLMGLAEGIVNAIPVLVEMLPQVIESILNYIVTALPMILQSGSDIILALANGIVQAIPTLITMLPIIINSIVETIVTNLPTIIQTGIQVLLALIGGIVQALPQLVAMLPTIVNTIGTILIQNLPLIINAGIQLLVAIITGLIQALPQLIGYLPTIIQTIVQVVASNLPIIISAGIQILLALVNGLIQAIPTLVGSIPQIISAIWNAFTSVNWLELGWNIIRGIGSGIVSAIGGLINSAIEACGQLVDSVKSFFGIHSPSRLMRDEIGKFLPMGIGVGFETEMPDLEKQVNDNMHELYAGLKGTVDIETARTTAQVATSSNYVAGVNDSPIGENNRTGGYGDRLVHTTINIDGRKVAEATSPYMDTELGNIQGFRERGGC